MIVLNFKKRDTNNLMMLGLEKLEWEVQKQSYGGFL